MVSYLSQDEAKGEDQQSLHDRRGDVYSSRQCAPNAFAPTGAYFI